MDVRAPVRRVLITNAGGALGLGFTRSLKASPEPFYLIGVDADKYRLQRAETHERHLVPRANDEDYIAILASIIEDTGAELVCPQLDPEVLAVSAARNSLEVRVFLPRHETIAACHNKYYSQQLWEQAGLPVPGTMLIRDEQDLLSAFRELGPRLWLRPVQGAGGRDSLPVSDLETARMWIEMKKGWGTFTAAQCLEQQSITWQSIWKDGELVVAQGRRRIYWEFGSRFPSGVSGITGTGETVSDPVVDETAMAAILAIDPRPHGVFSVDLTYDSGGVPNLTEINCGRFFTTHHFFTAAGLNMPLLYVKLAFGQELPPLPKKVNPLPPGLLWIRGMDTLPVLTDHTHVDRWEEELEKRREALRLASTVPTTHGSGGGRPRRSARGSPPTGKP